MWEILKKTKWMFMFILLEIYTYIKYKPNGIVELQNFLSIWSVVYSFIILYNIFGTKLFTAMSGTGFSGRNNINQYVNSRMYDDLEETINKRKKRMQMENGRLFDSRNLVYVFILIIHIVGYFIVA